MKIIRVIPFSRAIHKEWLTYFSADDIPLGSLIKVPVNKRQIDGLVIDCNDAVKEKETLKRSTYALKKVSKVLGPSFLSADFLLLAQHLALYYATETGVILSALVPTIFLKHAGSLSKWRTKEGRKSTLKAERLLLQEPLADRIIEYKTLIRESFARKQSIFICAPTIYHIVELTEKLKKGIEEYVFPLHHSLKDKVLLKSFERIVSLHHPVLIIGTGSFLCIPRGDIETVIIEEEGSEAHKMIARPYIDIRRVVETYASLRKMRLIWADTLIRPETVYQIELHEASELRPLSFRLKNAELLEMITLTKKRDSPRIPFALFDPKTSAAIKATLDAQKRVFLFSLRKGYAPITVCGDCGERLRCIHCHSSLIFLTGGTRHFRCPHCEINQNPDQVCKNCGSWNLVPLGIGIERVEDEIARTYPNAPLFIFSKDSISSHAQALEMISQFLKTPGSILLGTEMALFYLRQGVALTVIVSFDSLFSIPSYSISEKIMRLIATILSLSTERAILQTRTENESVLSYVKQGVLTDFYRNEIRDRKEYAYPPFTELIKIKFKGKRSEYANIKEHLHFLSKVYQEYFMEKNYSAHEGELTCIIKVPKHRWSLPKLLESGEFDRELAANLRTLPPGVSIQVGADNLM